jgi:uncharacterized protein (DUF433 family)
VKDKLLHLGEDMWSKTTPHVHEKRVVFVNPEKAVLEEIISGQGVLQIPLEIITGDMRDAVSQMRQRDPATVGRVERHRNVARNQEVIAGTRIPVRSVKAFADAGYSIDQIKVEYPTLTESDIRAAIEHAAAA